MRYEKKFGQLSNLIGVATGGDTEFLSKLRQMTTQGQVPDREEVVELLYETGLPQAEVVESDLDRAYSGQPLKYFAPARQLAEDFRRERSIRFPNEHPKIKTGKVDLSESGLRELLEADNIDPYKLNNHACPHERRAFYNSDQWSRRAKAIRAMDWFTCQQCGAKDKELHAHHEAPIFSVFSKAFARNFQVIRIETWCVDCHSEYHEEADRTSKRFVLRPGEYSEDLHERDKERRRKHDAARECLWCKKFVW